MSAARVVSNPSPTRRTIENGVGLPLANYIWDAKSRLTDARPIPASMRARLRQFGFSAAALQRVRYSTQWSATRGILGHANAVTLDDIIVFRSPSQVADFSLWAHEMVQIEQYARMGVEAFAREYTLQSWTLENPAYDTQNRAASWVRAQATYRQPAANPYNSWPNYNAPRQVSAAPRMVACATPQGTSAPYAGRPGESCFMQTPWGRFSGFAR